MSRKVWLARDADGKANLYSLYTGRTVLDSNGMTTTADETAECLAVFSPDHAEGLFEVTLQPGESVLGELIFQPSREAQRMERQSA